MMKDFESGKIALFYYSHLGTAVIIRAGIMGPALRFGPAQLGPIKYFIGRDFSGQKLSLP